MLASKLFNLYQNSIQPHFNLPAASISGGAGHILAEKEITGVMTIDILIKIVVPITSGIVVPIIHKWFADRKDARDLKREQLKSKDNECNGK